MTTHPLPQRALNEIASIWEVDEDQVLWAENGFDWTPASHCVRVRVFEDQRDISGSERFRISISTDLLKSAPVEDQKFVDWVSTWSHFLSSTYSLVYPPAEVWREYFNGKPASMSMFSSVYVDQNLSGWLPRLFAQMAIMQPIDAEIRAEKFPELGGSGSPAFADGSKKMIYDEILDVAEAIYVPVGRMQSKWVGTSEFETFAKQNAQSDSCFGFGDPTGMTLEAPFGTDSALIRFRTDESHPQLGSGLLVTTEIRAWDTIDDNVSEAAFLNYLESIAWTDFPQLGCWHIKLTGENKGRLAHSCFVPNALYRPGLVANFALWSIARVRWVRRERFPDMIDRTMAEILNARYQLRPL